MSLQVNAVPLYVRPVPPVDVIYQSVISSSLVNDIISKLNGILCDIASYRPVVYSVISPEEPVAYSLISSPSQCCTSQRCLELCHGVRFQIKMSTFFFYCCHFSNPRFASGTDVQFYVYRVCNPLYFRIKIIELPLKNGSLCERQIEPSKAATKDIGQQHTFRC